MFTLLERRALQFSDNAQKMCDNGNSLIISAFCLQKWACKKIIPNPSSHNAKSLGLESSKLNWLS